MEDGFKARAATMTRLLSSNETAFVLVVAPRADTIEEALYFVDQIESANISVRAGIVNRLTPQWPAVRARAASPLPHHQALQLLRAAAAAEDDAVHAARSPAGRRSAGESAAVRGGPA